MANRHVTRLIPAQEGLEGAGVKIRRSIGQKQGTQLDPVLLLDVFFSDTPADYLAGFPDHPHRGFETLTYMLEGHMLHADHLGNRGDLRAGGVQWMTAGRGIIHSEMPQQTEGRMRGFQLWLNLAAAEKMKDPGYTDIEAKRIPELMTQGASLRVIAGTLCCPGHPPVEGPVQTGRTDLQYFDITLEGQATTSIHLPCVFNAMVYAFEGSLMLADDVLPLHTAAITGAGDNLSLRAGDMGGRCLVIAGKPLGEPVVQYGPFVMNTRDEIEQALRDYRNGRLVEKGT